MMVWVCNGKLLIAVNDDVTGSQTVVTPRRGLDLKVVTSSHAEYEHSASKPVYTRTIFRRSAGRIRPLRTDLN